jgi:hypothetical protein
MATRSVPVGAMSRVDEGASAAKAELAKAITRANMVGDRYAALKMLRFMFSSDRRVVAHAASALAARNV